MLDTREELTKSKDQDIIRNFLERLDSQQIFNIIIESTCRVDIREILIQHILDEEILYIDRRDNEIQIS
ncbi:MAG: hypothetical protein PHW27_12975 [Melioribacteraceae bacterium]|nr:hypothetical protein [Melioribacteraceae bacterium]